MTRGALRRSLALWRARWRKAKPGTPARKRAYRLIKRRKAQLAPTGTSEAGVRFIASYEGFRSRPYNDAAGHATIGFGHLLHHGPVTQHDKNASYLSPAAARSLLADDLARFERAVQRLVTVPLSQHEFDALVSFAFNVGEGALAESTLLRNLNAGRRRAAADEFLRWDKAGGRALLGLTRRRSAERRIFLGLGYTTN